MMLDNANTLLAKREEYFKAPIPVVKLHYTGLTNRGIKETLLNKGILISGLENSLGEVTEISNVPPLKQPSSVDGDRLVRSYAGIAGDIQTGNSKSFLVDETLCFYIRYMHVGTTTVA